MIFDTMTRTQLPVMEDDFNNNFPDWSADNQWIAFTSDRDGNEEIYIMHTDGSMLKRLTNNPSRDIHPYFSPDGRYLLFNSTRGNGSFDIFRYQLESGELVKLSDTPSDETCARYSPDMQMILYLKNDATSDDIFIADSLNQSPQNLTRTPGIMDGWPTFDPSGRWVYYSSMTPGYYCIYRIDLKGENQTQVTTGGSNKEDARVSVASDQSFLVFNRRVGLSIEIRKLDLG